MARKSPYTTVLQASPTHLAFLRTRANGDDVAVEAQGFERGTWSAEDGSLQDALTEFVRAHDLADDRIVTVLPRHEAALRILELPSQNKAELDGMVRLGAEDIVPFPLEELHTAYCVLETLPDGGSRVLAVVVRKAVLQAHLDLVRAGGLEPDQVLLSTACLLTELHHRHAFQEAAAALHVSPDGLEVLVGREDTMAFGRGLAIDFSGEETLDARGIEDLTAELRASLATYRRESPDGIMPNGVTVSAEGYDPAAIAKALESSVDVPLHAPETASPSLAALGAARVAAGDRRFFVGLLPEAEVRRRAAATTRTRGLRIGAMVAAALVATAAVYAQAVYQRRAYLDKLEGYAEELRPVARSLRTKRQQLRFLSDQVDRSMSPLQMLHTIVQLAPEDGLNVTRYAYDRSEGIILNGSAVQPALFDTLIDSLRGQGAQSFPQFARAQELYRNARRERDQQVWDFAVTIPFPEEGAGE